MNFTSILIKYQRMKTIINKVKNDGLRAVDVTQGFSRMIYNMNCGDFVVGIPYAIEVETYVVRQDKRGLLPFNKYKIMYFMNIIFATPTEDICFKSTDFHYTTNGVLESAIQQALYYTIDSCVKVGYKNSQILLRNARRNLSMLIACLGGIKAILI